MDPEKKFFLFKKTQHFCSVPWNYLKINTDGKVHTCVKGKSVLGNINDQTIQDILKNPELKKIRQDLFHDRESSNCVSCRELDHTGKSYSYLRSMYNDWFKKNPVDYSDFDNFYLSGIDLHWSSTCNLKCITCWSRQSSAIASEIGAPILHVPSDQAQKIIDWTIAQQHQLKELYFSGGEPTLIKHNVHLLERLEPREDLLLRINTNMTFDRDNPFIQQLSRFPNVLFTMSADSTHQRFEYIRQGAKWKDFLNNLEWLGQGHYQLRINSVFFVASAFTLLETQGFFKKNFDITDFTINQCEMEKYDLFCRNLPDNLKKTIGDGLRDILSLPDLDTNLSGQISNCLIELEKEPNGRDYRNYFNNIDRLRGTDWKEIFKELI